MDPRLLRYYNSELQHLRDVGGAFAKAFPKIAGRLGLDEFACADPYVERLLEGFAFLTARIQMKLDAEFPQFAQHLFEIIYPHYLAPTPSMMVVQFQPDLSAGTLVSGVDIPRHTALRSRYPAIGATFCEYRTAHDLTLWPLELLEVNYRAESTPAGAVALADVKAALQLRLRCSAGVSFAQLDLERLPLYLRGAGQTPVLLYEQLLADCVGFRVRPGRQAADWVLERTADQVQALGFADEHALLPDSARSFAGYRLLREYFAFPQRFLFVELCGLREAVRRCTDTELELTLYFNRYQTGLERRLDAQHLVLFCTPAINVFPKRCDRVQLARQRWEHHLVADRTRPGSFEIYQVMEVEGYGAGADVEQIFQPFYSANEALRGNNHCAYFQVHRIPGVTPATPSGEELHDGYVGTEVFLSLVDTAAAPYRSDLRQLGVSALCTNRGLPTSVPIGTGSTDFCIDTGAPVTAIRCLAGPTRPRPACIGAAAERGSVAGQGEVSWRFISHMALNYLSLCDQDPVRGASSLRELLGLYGELSEQDNRRQIEGLRSVNAQPITRRIPIPGPIVFGRGLEVTLEFDDSSYAASGAFVLAAVLERFFAQYVSINAFVETVVRSDARGEIKRWPTRIGLRHLL